MQLEWIGPFINYKNKLECTQILQLTKKDEFKLYWLLSRPYMSEEFLNSEGNSKFKQKLMGYKEHMKEMVASNNKFEVEALFSSKETNKELEELLI